MDDVQVLSLPQELKTRFKQRCGASLDAQNWQVRVHRALSWYARALEMPQGQPEAKFLYLWIAMNSLYARWDAEKNAPAYDGHGRERLMDRLLKLDRENLIRDCVKQNRPLVKKLLENPFLSNVFWRDPANPKAKGWAAEDANYLDRNLKGGDYLRVLNQVLERLYVFRGQLVHGASTGGSRLNRKPLAHCSMFLEQFVPITLIVVIDHGADESWPELCYPPMD